MTSQKVYIKVHGTVYETLMSTLQRFPCTRLGSETKRIEFQDGNSEVLSLECKSSVFDAILFYYQSYGILRRPNDVSMGDFVKECRKLEIDEEAIRRMQEREGFLYEMVMNKIQLDGCSFQQVLWQFLESPESSTSASVFAIFSCVLVAASTFLACIQTMPIAQSVLAFPFYKNPILLAELSLNSFFGIEYILRFIASPRKFSFVRSISNLIDFFAVYPYFVVVMIDEENVSSVKFLRVVRTVRILRLLRLTKYSKTLDIAVKIMGNCIGDLVSMVLIIFISCFICGTLEYSAEMNTQDTQFISIPASLWWAAQTVIPVGYGDIVPKSTMGKIVGGVVVVLSALTFTLHLLFLGGKFLKFYAKNFGVKVQNDFKSK